MDLRRLLLSVFVDEICGAFARQSVVVVPAVLEILATRGICFAEAGREGRESREGRVCHVIPVILVLNVHDIGEAPKRILFECTLPLALWSELSDEDGKLEEAINAVLDSQHQFVHLENRTGCLWAGFETCG